ncbi:MAG TPA: hypothetical protein VII08_17035 [Myxococcales bacterium]
MPILATLRQSRAGEWKNLDEYLRELRHRETGALAALANALSAPPHEQKELVAHGEGGAILIEVACDLRVPKGARLAASRALLEAGIAEPFVGHLFIGAGDLVTDPRLGAMARKLVESGLPSALQLGGESAQITLAAGAFARAAYAGASAVGVARIQELLEPAKELHAGAIAALFALDAGELPENHRNGWKRLLEQTCAAHRRAPAAARRVGLAPAWPPNLPGKFAPFIEDAERQNAAVEAADAAANPAALKKVRAAAQPTGKAREATTEKAPLPAGKKLAPPIRRSPFKRAIGTVVEVPPTLPSEPMEALAARGAAAVEPPRPRIERTEEAPPSRGPLPIAPLLSRERNELRFDARGQRIPRADRWSDDQFEWESPVLPSSDLPPPARARVAPGPFAARLRSIFDDRPEAVDRLCAAAEARAAVRGEPELLRELAAELSRGGRDRVLPREQVQRLRSILRDHAHPPAWSAAAGILLDFFVSGRA